MDGKDDLGASSPDRPALHIPEPLSITSKGDIIRGCLYCSPLCFDKEIENRNLSPNEKTNKKDMFKVVIYKITGIMINDLPEGLDKSNLIKYGGETSDTEYQLNIRYLLPKELYRKLFYDEHDYEYYEQYLDKALN